MQLVSRRLSPWPRRPTLLKLLPAMILPALFCLVWPCSTARGQETKDEPRVARLIKNLGSDAYLDRKQASAELARRGASVRRQLEKAADSPDAEVRLHALSLLKNLKLADIWAPALVDCQTQNLPAKDVLELLAQQSGNHILTGDQYGPFHDLPVTLDLTQVPFWRALDALCQGTGNQVRQHFDTRSPGLVLVAGEPGKFPAAYAGPVRARVTSARRVFIEEYDYEQAKSDVTHTFQLNVQMMWEDRFRLVAYKSQPELVSAITADGQELPGGPPSGSSWNVANAGTRQVAMTLRLQPPSVAAPTLRSLTLKWGLIAVGDMATLEVADLASTEPHVQDDVELIVESIQERPPSRYEVTVIVNRDLVIPQPQEVVFQENEFELLDAAGQPFRKQSQTNNLTDQGAKIRFTFSSDTPGAVPGKLRFSYPRLRAEKDLEIEFRDVPLPVGRPE
ncbi:MAG: hypothetical protein AB7O62_04325 [Pirellulales bacterium]